ncbi:MAG: dihydroxyacetone kinase subunit DhaL [Candidatus Binatia bacterium]
MVLTSTADVDLVVRTMAETIVANEKYFCELDAVAADGDFGSSLARGFEVVLKDFVAFDRTSIGAFLKKIALVISGKVGGTSGPLWGTAFLRAGAVAGDRLRLAPVDLIAMLRAAVAGIQQRGGAQLGDKTLLDALVPAIDSLEADLANPDGTADYGIAALQRAADVATRAAEATTGLVAKKGRAAYTGERSVGSPDAGAVAIGVILQSISAAWRESHGAGKEQR